MPFKKRLKELKDVAVGVKLPASVVFLIDEDATREYTSRSHILRRIATEHYKTKAAAS